MRLSEMCKEHLEHCVDRGDYSNQDVIDLYDDLLKAEEEIKRLEMHIEKIERAGYV